MISHRKRQIKNKEEVNRKKISGEKNEGFSSFQKKQEKKLKASNCDLKCHLNSSLPFKHCGALGNYEDILLGPLPQ